MDIFFIFSGLYLLAIVSLTVLIFLWIIGASKNRNDKLLAAQTSPFHPIPSVISPAPSTPSFPAHNLIPRRLSFSAAAGTPTPLPLPRRRLPTDDNTPPIRQQSTRRRVTFSLTPEQQRAEQIKALTTPPSHHQFFPHHQDDLQYDHHLPEQHMSQPPLIELFPDAPTDPPTQKPKQKEPQRRPRTTSNSRHWPTIARPASQPQQQEQSSLPTNRPSDDSDNPLFAVNFGFRSEVENVHNRRRRSEDQLRDLEEKGVVVPDIEGYQQVTGFIPKRKTAFANGPMAVRGFEGEVVMFAGQGRKRRAATTA